MSTGCCHSNKEGRVSAIARHSSSMSKVSFNNTGLVIMANDSAIAAALGNRQYCCNWLLNGEKPTKSSNESGYINV
jgi:hypothetical protein